MDIKVPSEVTGKSMGTHNRRFSRGFRGQCIIEADIPLCSATGTHLMAPRGTVLGLNTLDRNVDNEKTLSP